MIRILLRIRAESGSVLKLKASLALVSGHYVNQSLTNPIKMFRITGDKGIMEINVSQTSCLTRVYHDPY